MKTNLNFSIKLPIKTNISLFFTNHYFKYRIDNNNISCSRAVKNISINNIKSIIKKHLDTLIMNKGRYLFSLYTDSSHTVKAYFLIVSENKNLESNALNFVIVSAGTSSNLKIKFKNIFPHNRFFINDLTCEDLINQDILNEKKWEATKIKNQTISSLKLLDTSPKRKNITFVDKSSIININKKLNITKSIHNPSKITRTYCVSKSDNYVSQIENRFLSIENRLEKINIPFSLSNTLTIDYLDYLENLLIEFGQLSLSKGSYKNILTTSNNLRNLLTNNVIG